MFWGTKNKNKKTTKSKKAQDLQKSCSGGKHQGFAGDALRAQALENVRVARAHIGEDVLDRIAEAMARKQNSPMEQARARIQNTDPAKVALELKAMMEDR